MIKVKVSTEDAENFNKVKAIGEIKGGSIEITHEIFALLKLLEKEHLLELTCAMEKIVLEDKINEKA